VISVKQAAFIRAVFFECVILHAAQICQPEAHASSPIRNIRGACKPRGRPRLAVVQERRKGRSILPASHARLTQNQRSSQQQYHQRIHRLMLTRRPNKMPLSERNRPPNLHVNQNRLHRRAHRLRPPSIQRRNRGQRQNRNRRRNRNQRQNLHPHPHHRHRQNRNRRRQPLQPCLLLHPPYLHLATSRLHRCHSSLATNRGAFSAEAAGKAT
jgi:hypothetical protein